MKPKAIEKNFKDLDFQWIRIKNIEELKPTKDIKVCFLLGGGQKLRDMVEEKEAVIKTGEINDIVSFKSFETIGSKIVPRDGVSMKAIKGHLYLQNNGKSMLFKNHHVRQLCKYDDEFILIAGTGINPREQI